MEPVVVEMHTKSGLLDQIRASTITLEDAGAQTLEFIKQYVPQPRTVPLCGNSHRHGPPLPRRVPARDRAVPALPQRRREQREGARAPLVPVGAEPPAPASRARTGRSTTSARASPSCATTASTCSCRSPRRPPTPRDRSAGSADAGHPPTPPRTDARRPRATRRTHRRRGRAPPSVTVVVALDGVAVLDHHRQRCAQRAVARRVPARPARGTPRCSRARARRSR